MGDSEKDNTTPETPEADQPEAAESAPEETPAVEPAATTEETVAPEEAPAAAEATPAEQAPSNEQPVAAEGTEAPTPAPEAPVAAEGAEAPPPAAEVPAAPEGPEVEPEAPAAVEEAKFPAPQPDEHGRFYGTGRRKTSVARVYLRPGNGQIQVNGRSLEEAFTSPAWREHARSALVFSGVADQYDAQISVKGGGSSGQAGAIRQGLARAVVLANPALRPKLRQKGFLTRDPRMKERQKYGQKGARKRFQWTKR